MVSEMLVNELKENVGNMILFFVETYRFEGKILDVDDSYLKYFDTRKDKIRYVKIAGIGEWEVLE